VPSDGSSTSCIWCLSKKTTCYYPCKLFYYSLVITILDGEASFISTLPLELQGVLPLPTGSTRILMPNRGKKGMGERGGGKACWA
jgi:hypothetical protein